MLEGPPAVRDSQSCFPEQADEQDEEKGEAEGAPVNEAPRNGEKTHGWKQGADDEAGEVAGKACLVCWEGEMFLVKPCGTDQDDDEDQRGGMKLEKAAHLFCFKRIVRHVVGRQPELTEPNVEEKNCEKAS